MQTEDESGPAESRGRIVMLVDNGVQRDSRVQKAATSIAAAGWEVHLIGCTSGKKKRRWTLGDANVLLVPLSLVLNKPRFQVLRSNVRRPLAYAHPSSADYRRRLVQARRADIAASRLAPGSTGAVRKAWLAARRVTAKFQQRWVALRLHQTDSLANARMNKKSPVERFTLAFWQKLLGDRVWRVLDRSLWDWDSAYGKVIDKLQPDIIHANDFRMLGVGARATWRARIEGRQVKLVWDAHEFLPGIRPWHDGPRWHPAVCAYEREYSGAADAVITVSDPLADMLVERHGLKEKPGIVLNAPVVDELTTTDPVPDLRELCEIGPDAPLAVYSGGPAAQRGLDIMVETLPRLPALHIALIVPAPGHDDVKRLLNRADELGVRDRVHPLPYVPFDQVVPFLSSADLGVIPIHHWPNHEIALITKFFEYSHARLPIVVSDVKAMSDMVRSTGQGEVFTAKDEDEYVRAVEEVLKDPKRYSAVYDKRPDLLRAWTWEAQAEFLDALYTKLLPSAARQPAAKPSTTSA